MILGKDYWVENGRERTEMLLPGPAHALGALLDVAVPDLAGGEGLPLLWHWLYLLDRPAQAELGLDGASVAGSIALYPTRGQRRMWAGGRVRSQAPLRCGEMATKRSRVLSVQEKQGRSGILTFITVGHEILQNGRVAIDEQQDIVYQEISTAPSEAAVPLEEDRRTAPSGYIWKIDTPPTLLFRFSALTYNAHRIHYDREYARNTEGYPGLLVQGPLQAIAMAEAARAAACNDGLRDWYLSFQYRMISPLFDDQGMVVSAIRGEGATVTAVRDDSGRQTAAGRVWDAAD